MKWCLSGHGVFVTGSQASATEMDTDDKSKVQISALLLAAFVVYFYMSLSLFQPPWRYGRALLVQQQAVKSGMNKCDLSLFSRRGQERREN